MKSINFKEELALKGIGVSDLPKSQQKKIYEFEQLYKKVEQIEDDVDENSREEFESIKQELQTADQEISVFIRNFDVEKAREQRERLAKMRDRKLALKASKEKGEEGEPEQEEVQVPKVVPVPEPVSEVPPPPPVLENEQSIGQHIQELKQEARIQPERFEIEEEEDVDICPDCEEKLSRGETIEVEAEEFEKQGERKPKKLNLPLVVMGVGALLLTWGAVNFFKERR